MFPKLIIIVLGIYLLYITHAKIVKINKGKEVQFFDNVIAMIAGSIIAIFEWSEMCNEGWHLYFVGLVVICSILPIYIIAKKYFFN